MHVPAAWICEQAGGDGGGGGFGGGGDGDGGGDGGALGGDSGGGDGDTVAIDEPGGVSIAAEVTPTRLRASASEKAVALVALVALAAAVELNQPPSVCTICSLMMAGLCVIQNRTVAAYSTVSGAA